MVASISGSKESISGIDNTSFVDDVTHDTVKNDTQRLIDSPPSQTSTTSIGCRVITCAGKVLLGVFTVPAMAVFTSLCSLVSSIAILYQTLVELYEINKICAIILSVTLMPPVAIMIGVASATAGLFVGMKRGATIAYELSLDPLRLTWIKMKEALSFQS